jgi:hypothetical protein
MSFDDRQLEASPYAAPRSLSRERNGLTHLLFCTGLLLVALGLGLAAAKELSPEAARVAEKLAGRGLGWDVVGALGATLLGLGVVRRAVSSVGARLEGLRDEQIDMSLLQERVVGELADLRNGHSAAPAAAAGGPISGQNEKDALFRLAASLDQLAARIDKRVQTDLAGLSQQLERVTGALGKIEQRLGQPEAKRPAPAVALAAVPAAAPAAAPVAAPVAVTRPPMYAPPVPATPFAPVPQSRDEDGPIVIDLDAQERVLELFDRMNDPDGNEADGNLREAQAPLPGLRSGSTSHKAHGRDLGR